MDFDLTCPSLEKYHGKVFREFERNPVVGRYSVFRWVIYVMVLHRFHSVDPKKIFVILLKIKFHLCRLFKDDGHVQRFDVF